MQISEMEAFHTKLISTFNCSDLDFVLLLKPEVKRPNFISVILAVPLTSYQYVFSRHIHSTFCKFQVEIQQAQCKDKERVGGRVQDLISFKRSIRFLLPKYKI